MVKDEAFKAIYPGMWENLGHRMRKDICLPQSAAAFDQLLPVIGNLVEVVAIGKSSTVWCANQELLIDQTEEMVQGVWPTVLLRLMQKPSLLCLLYCVSFFFLAKVRAPSYGLCDIWHLDL